MPEVRLIDANALKKDLSEFNYDMALRIVDTQPTIEAEPVRHGRWETWGYVFSRHRVEKMLSLREVMTNDAA